MNMGMAAGGISPIVAGYFAQTYTLQPVWLVAAAVILCSSFVLLGVRKLPVSATKTPQTPCRMGVWLSINREGQKMTISNKVRLVDSDGQPFSYVVKGQRNWSVPQNRCLTARCLPRHTWSLIL
ncbi:hypothetical protein [Candidatus Pantoea bituminis]|uniref:hypothetical protein n=1 Tax=Candidatus Pantoea bituminis TaxID=2831036 RepID=UPI001C060638|nr:hypothetical protein [Pantoea bituminis]